MSRNDKLILISELHTYLIGLIKICKNCIVSNLIDKSHYLDYANPLLAL